MGLIAKREGFPPAFSVRFYGGWRGSFLGCNGVCGIRAARCESEFALSCQPDATNNKERKNHYVKQSQNPKGLQIKGLDGEIGKVKEFYFDDLHWTIRYLVANTGNWLTGRQVLISPYALIAIFGEKQCIDINLTKKQIENSPPLNSDKPVSRQFEENYYGYYGWPMYWGGPSVGVPIPTLCMIGKNGRKLPRVKKHHGIPICAALTR